MAFWDRIIERSPQFQKLAARVIELDRRQGELHAENSALLVYLSHLIEGADVDSEAVRAGLTRLSLRAIVDPSFWEPIDGKAADRVLSVIQHLSTS